MERLKREETKKCTLSIQVCNLYLDRHLLPYIGILIIMNLDCLNEIDVQMLKHMDDTNTFKRVILIDVDTCLKLDTNYVGLSHFRSNIFFIYFLFRRFIRKPYWNRSTR